MEKNFNNLENNNNGKKEKHVDIVARVMAPLLLCSILASSILNGVQAKKNAPIYYDKEFGDFYTQTGKDIYKVTVKVDAQDYPCEKVQDIEYTAPVGYRIENGLAVKNVIDLDGNVRKVLGNLEANIHNNYVVTERKNTGVFQDNSVNITYPEEYINVIGAVYDEDSEIISFPDRYYISYSFDTNGKYNVQDCEIVDVEKIETKVLDGSVSNYVIDVSSNIEDLTPMQGKSLEKKMQ